MSVANTMAFLVAYEAVLRQRQARALPQFVCNVEEAPALDARVLRAAAALGPGHVTIKQVFGLGALVEFADGERVHAVIRTPLLRLL